MIETVYFIGQCLGRFRELGAVMPSSPILARAMVAAVPALPVNEVIVELGPGTGVFTRELIRRFPRNRILAIEFNQSFAQRLRREMPEVEVVEGCASNLSIHLDRYGIGPERVGAVVSGLPLLSLPRDLAANIFAGIADCLEPGRRYVQFTYSKRAWRKRPPVGFQLEKTRRVWLNLPPAQVLPFTRLTAEVAVA